MGPFCNKCPLNEVKVVPGRDYSLIIAALHRITNFKNDISVIKSEHSSQFELIANQAKITSIEMKTDEAAIEAHAINAQNDTPTIKAFQSCQKLIMDLNCDHLSIKNT